MHTITVNDLLLAKEQKARVTLASSSDKKRLDYDFQFNAYTIIDLNNEYNIRTTADTKEAVDLYNAL